DLRTYLAKARGGTTKDYRKKTTVFSQGSPADAVFYIEKGKVKLTVLSTRGKEAVVAILGSGDFFGEGSLAGQPLRMATATSMTEGSIRRIKKDAMIRMLHDERAFSELFMSYLLSRNTRIEEDLVDQLFNSSEKRLVQNLLLIILECMERRASSDRDPGNVARRWALRAGDPERVAPAAGLPGVDGAAEAAPVFAASIEESSDDAIVGETLDGVITSWNA